MLERVQRKGNPLTLLVGMQTSTATMEKSMLLSLSQSCPTLCDPMDCSLTSSSIPRIFQVRILNSVAISFSRGLPQLRYWTCIFCVSCIGRQIFLPLSHPGSSREQCKCSYDPEGCCGGGERGVWDWQHVYTHGRFMLMCGKTNTIL